MRRACANKIIFFLLISLILGLPSSAAAASRSTADLGPVQKDPGREWTIMVYLDGDNNLEAAGLKDLEEMEAGLPAGGVEVIVLFDRSAEFSRAEGDWTDARIYRVRPDAGEGLKSEVLAAPGEVNMGDPQTLQTFITAAVKTFPARRYALILWNHGGGWAAHVSDEKAPGAPGEHDSLTLPELRGAITRVLAETGLKKLDLIGFDMCLMAQLETAYELEGLAEVMVGSEASEPNQGWPYDTVLPLFGRPGLATRDTAQGIVKAFDDYYRPQGTAMATQSAFDLTKVGELVRSMDAFLSRLDPALPRAWPALTRSLFFSVGYGDLDELRRGPGATLSIDLGDSLSNLVGVLPELKAAPEYLSLQKALKNFVLDSKTSHRFRKSQGVAVYAPFRRDLWNQEYRQTRFAQNSGWLQTLNGLYAVQAQNPAQPRIKGIETYSLYRNQPVGEVIQMGQDGFAFTFEGTNVLWALAFIGVRDEAKGRTLIFEKSFLRKEWADEGLTVKKREREELLETLAYSDGEHQVGFRYDGLQGLVTNGRQIFPATIDQSDVGDLESFLSSVPAVLEHPQVGKLFGRIYFNWLSQAVTMIVQVPQKDGSFMSAQVEPPPEADIHLLLEALPDRGESTYVTSGTLKWGDGLSLTRDLIEPGQYEVILFVETLTGQSAMARHRFPVQARDDDLGLAATRHRESIRADMIPDNFIGEWEVIDADQWFKQGRLTGLAGFATYEPHPKFKSLLKVTLHKPRGKNLMPGLDIVDLISTSGLPHLRQYVLDQNGAPRLEYGARMSFPIFDQKDGQNLMLSFDLVTGELQVFVKRSGPPLKLSTVAAGPGGQPASVGPQAQPGGPGSPVVGTWQTAQGEAVVFTENQWAYYQAGRMADGGVYQVQGNQLTTQSAGTGQVVPYMFQVTGNQLLLQNPAGQVYQFFRVQ